MHVWFKILAAGCLSAGLMGAMELDSDFTEQVPSRSGIAVVDHVVVPQVIEGTVVDRRGLEATLDTPEGGITVQLLPEAYESAGRLVTGEKVRLHVLQYAGANAVLRVE